MNKKSILTAATILFIGLSAFAQTGFPNTISRGLEYEVRATYKRAIKEEKLNDAKLLSDIIDGYPVNWITNYVSVEILAICNGKAVKAISANDALSTEQKNILAKADLASDLVVNVKYKYKNPIGDNIESNKINVAMTIMPETEAEYTGGQNQMLAYLKENAINKISKTLPDEFKLVIIKFTVNEEGTISNAKVTKATSGDRKIEQVLLDALNKMPKWKPAKNAKGVYVKQEFEFLVGKQIYGC